MRSPTLNAAILTWMRGHPIPTDMWVKLASQGYDVSSLERRYFH